jgi:hypothetical protein
MDGNLNAINPERKPTNQIDFNINGCGASGTFRHTSVFALARVGTITQQQGTIRQNNHVFVLNQRLFILFRF